VSDVWENARKNAKPDCPTCHGTGRFAYDHNHTTICRRCCLHNMGWWQLTEAHGAENAGKWCCLAGCGHTVDECPTPKP
jgi:hypothetical protein